MQGIGIDIDSKRLETNDTKNNQWCIYTTVSLWHLTTGTIILNEPVNIYIYGNIYYHNNYRSRDYIILGTFKKYLKKSDSINVLHYKYIYIIHIIFNT